MTPIDLAALKRCLTAARAESKSRAGQIGSMLLDRPWQRVAVFASTCVQATNLGLMPWQLPPCRANLADLDLPYGDVSGRRESAELLKKLLALGLSRFESDPPGAIAAVERQAAG